MLIWCGVQRSYAIILMRNNVHKGVEPGNEAIRVVIV